MVFFIDQAFLCSRSANSTEEPSKIAKKEKEEKDKKRKSSVFLRFGSSYRTKKVSSCTRGRSLLDLVIVNLQ